MKRHVRVVSTAVGVYNGFVSSPGEPSTFPGERKEAMSRIQEDVAYRVTPRPGDRHGIQRDGCARVGVSQWMMYDI